MYVPNALVWSHQLFSAKFVIWIKIQNRSPQLCFSRNLCVRKCVQNCWNVVEVRLCLKALGPCVQHLGADSHSNSISICTARQNKMLKFQRLEKLRTAVKVSCSRGASRSAIQHVNLWFYWFIDFQQYIDSTIGQYPCSKEQDLYLFELVKYTITGLRLIIMKYVCLTFGTLGNNTNQQHLLIAHRPLMIWSKRHNIVPLQYQILWTSCKQDWQQTATFHRQVSTLCVMKLGHRLDISLGKIIKHEPK